MSANDDDLYGDLYGNDVGGDIGEFDVQENEAKGTKPAPEPVAASAGVTKATTPADSKPVALTPTTAKIASPVVKKDEPLTNPIPTFTEDTSSYSGPGKTYASSTPNASTENRNSQNMLASTGGSQQGIEIVGGNEGARPSTMKEEGKMFVGGLNWDTTDDGLRNYFSQFGTVDACTIMRDPAGRSRGFAFLTFDDPAAVNKVMVQEHYLDGKIIDPKRAIPRTEHQRTVKMFVGGLAPSVTNDSMREYFSQFGKVIDSTVMVDRDSSRSKGFGFVTFDDQSGAERLFGMNGLQIDGKTIEVKMAQPRAGLAAERGQGGGGQAQGNNFNRSGSAGAGAGGGYGSNPNFGGGGGGNTPFDPQALATLYQRMAQLAGGGQGNWGMNGMMQMPGVGMGMMPGMSGGGGGMMMGPGGVGMSQVPSGPAGMRGGYNGGMNDGMGGMNGHQGGGGGGMRGGAIPRGPAAMRGGPAGGGGPAGVPTGPSGGLGPARMGRGHQHNYHPYSR